MTRVIALDIGTGFVKACSETKKVQFPALYAYREAGEWENQKERIEGTGIEAVKISEYPKSVVMRPVREGVPSNKNHNTEFTLQFYSKSFFICMDSFLDISLLAYLIFEMIRCKYLGNSTDLKLKKEKITTSYDGESNFGYNL